MVPSITDVVEGVAKLHGDPFRRNPDVGFVLSPSASPSPDITVEPGMQIPKEVIAQ
jgi:hypothetical protein